MKTFFKIFIRFINVVYISFSLFTLSNCTNNFDDGSTNHWLKSARGEVVILLKQKYNATMFECSGLELIGQTIVIDSTLISVVKKGKEYFLKAKINSPCNKKYFAELMCDNQIVDTIYQMKTNSLFIAAKISKIYDHILLAEADSLNGKMNLELGSSVLLSGDCLAVEEIPSFAKDE